MTDLSRVGEREALKPRREPHWQRIRPGCFLGYRTSARGGAGTWIARAYDEQTRGYRLKALGSFGELPMRDRYAVAKKEAEAFADLVEAGGHSSDRPETVAEACQNFAANNAEVEGRFKRHVYGDPIANIKLDKLRRHHVMAWRKRLEEKPAMVTRRKSGEQVTKPRSPSSVNRDQAVLRAALARVLAPGAPNTEAAWQEPLKPIKNATGRRTLYLDRTQRRALIEAVSDDVRPFIQALCLLPFRPGAAANLNAGDFDKRTRELTVGKDKTGRPRRIMLPDAAAALFSEQAKNKLPAAPLFTRQGGKRWDKHTWKGPIKEAIRSAKLPADATAYTLRHSTITDLVTAGLPLLTVAQISDTSAEMIERHYGHLTGHQATEALAGLEL